MNRERRLLGIVFGLAVASNFGPAAVAEDGNVPGEEFLEFLGGLDNEKEWQEFFDNLPDPDEHTETADGPDDEEPDVDNS